MSNYVFVGVEVNFKPSFGFSNNYIYVYVIKLSKN